MCNNYQADLTTVIVIVIEKQLNLLNFYVTFKNKTVDDKSSLCFFWIKQKLSKLCYCA